MFCERVNAFCCYLLAALEINDWQRRPANSKADQAGVGALLKHMIRALYLPLSAHFGQ